MKPPSEPLPSTVHRRPTRPLLQRATIEEFVAAPHDRYVVGGNWLHYTSNGVAGSVLWGALHAPDAAEMMRVVPATHAAATTPLVGVVDASDLASIDPGALGLLKQYFETFHDDLRRIVRRGAVVRPRALLLAALSEGFFRIVPAPYPLAVFGTLDESVAWLSDPKVRAVVDEIALYGADERATTSVRARLRSLLVDRLRFVSIEDGAAWLDLSPRALQRRLKAEGTTFRGVLNAARVEAAQRAMLGSGRPLGQIAYDVGCATPAHLTGLFRRLVGQSPSEWLRAHRAGISQELTAARG